MKANYDNLESSCGVAALGGPCSLDPYTLRPVCGSLEFLMECWSQMSDEVSRWMYLPLLMMSTPAAKARSNAQLPPPPPPPPIKKKKRKENKEWKKKKRKENPAACPAMSADEADEFLLLPFDFKEWRSPLSVNAAVHEILHAIYFLGVLGVRLRGIMKSSSHHRCCHFSLPSVIYV